MRFHHAGTETRERQDEWNHRCTQMHTDKTARYYLCESVCICGSNIALSRDARLRVISDDEQASTSHANPPCIHGGLNGVIEKTALFDARNPIKLIAREDAPFIRPTEVYERTGQYAEGTTFVEALVPFKGRWFLYYGTADSRVGVATLKPK